LTFGNTPSLRYGVPAREAKKNLPFLIGFASDEPLKQGLGQAPRFTWTNHLSLEPAHLPPDETKAFVDNAFRDGVIPVTGTAITKILPPVSRFSKNNGHSVKKQTVLDKLGEFFERYFGLA